MSDVSEEHAIDMDSYFDLELDKAVARVLEVKPKGVLLQLPEGLKPRATEIIDYIEEKTNTPVYSWGESCFGACDTPVGLNHLPIDLIIQWGHTPWRFEQD